MMNGEILNIEYTEVVAYHYRYRGVVENHNALSHNGGNKY